MRDASLLDTRPRIFAGWAAHPRPVGAGLLFLALLSTLPMAWLILRGLGLVAVGGLIFALSYVVILARWRFGIYGLLIFLPFAGMVTLALYPWAGPPILNPVLYKDWLFVLPAYIGFLASLVLERERLPRLGRLPSVLLIAFSVLVLAQMANPGVQNALMALIGAKVWLFYVPLFPITLVMVRSRRELIFLLRLLVALAIVPCAVGMGEFALGQIYGHETVMQAVYGTMAPEARPGFGVYEVGGGLLPRGTPSTFTFVTQFFGYLVSMLVACYAVWRADPSPRWRRFGHYMLIVVALNALLVGARSAFVFVPFLLLLVYGLDLGHRGLLRAGALIGGIIGGAVLMMRMGIVGLFEHVAELFVVYAGETAYGGLVQALVAAPLGAGTGTNTGPARYSFSDPASFAAIENYYAKAAYELGILGLLLVWTLFFTLIRHGLKTRRQLADPGLRACAAALVAFLITMALNNFKGWLIDLDPINVYFWVFVGLLAKLTYLDAPPGKSTGQPSEGRP